MFKTLKSCFAPEIKYQLQSEYLSKLTPLMSKCANNYFPSFFFFFFFLKGCSKLSSLHVARQEFHNALLWLPCSAGQVGVTVIVQRYVIQPPYFVRKNITRRTRGKFLTWVAPLTNGSWQRSTTQWCRGIQAIFTVTPRRLAKADRHAEGKVVADYVLRTSVTNVM